MTFVTNTLTLERSIRTSPARLFHLMTDARMREVWGAPNDDTVLVMEREDLREGGSERHRCGPKDAPEFVVDTVWYRIEAPHAACFTETIVIGTEKLFTSLVTYNLRADGAATHLTVDIALTGFADGVDMAADVQAGWTSGLKKLERLAMASSERKTA